MTQCGQRQQGRPGGGRRHSSGGRSWEGQAAGRALWVGRAGRLRRPGFQIGFRCVSSLPCGPEQLEQRSRPQLLPGEVPRRSVGKRGSLTQRGEETGRRRCRRLRMPRCLGSPPLTHRLGRQARRHPPPDPAMSGEPTPDAPLGLAGAPSPETPAAAPLAPEPAFGHPDGHRTVRLWAGHACQSGAQQVIRLAREPHDPARRRPALPQTHVRLHQGVRGQHGR